jgi:hypothetical protein
MTRYYFDFTVSSVLNLDETGIEFSSPGEAEQEAIQALCELILESAADRNSSPIELRVRGGDAPLLHLSFSIEHHPAAG